MMRGYSLPTSCRGCRCSCFSPGTLRRTTHATLSEPPRGTHEEEHATMRNNSGVFMPQVNSDDNEIVDVEMATVEENVKEEGDEIGLAQNAPLSLDKAPGGEGTSEPKKEIFGVNGGQEEHAVHVENPQKKSNVVAATSGENGYINLTLNARLPVGFD